MLFLALGFHNRDYSHREVTQCLRLYQEGSNQGTERFDASIVFPEWIYPNGQSDIPAPNVILNTKLDGAQDRLKY